MRCQHPADPIAGRGGLRERATGDDARTVAEKLGRYRANAIEAQIAVDIVFDQHRVKLFNQLDEFATVTLRHCHAKRVRQARREHAGLDWILLQRSPQLRQHHTFFRAGLNFDREHAQAINQFEQAVIRRRFDGNDIAGRCDSLQCEKQRFLATVGDRNVIRFCLYARTVEIVIGDLPSQGRFTKRRGVAQAALFGARHDALHCAMQGLRSRFGHTRIGDSQRHEVRVIDAFVDADHQWTTIQAHRLPVRRWGRVDQRIGGPVAYVKS